MDNNRLSERESTVLQAHIRAYVDNGVPVGSQVLLKREDWGISAATVRNTLASLEAKGYLHQPHTSAGRVPTDRGYRYYVSECMGPSELQEEATWSELDGYWTEAEGEGSLYELLRQLAKIIGDVSHMLGLVLAPGFEQGVFNKVELVSLGHQRLLLVLSIRQGLVKSLVLEAGSAASQRELERLSWALNERLHGLTIAEIRRSADERLKSLQVGDPQLLQVVLAQIRALSALSADDLYIAGTGNICLQPDFRDPFQVAGLMDLVERKQKLAELLGGRQGVMVTIGRENEQRAMRQCSMVTASYNVGGVQGVIGVIGPVRMPYAKVMALVNRAAVKAAGLVC
jgi:heat-inducible transcriptional repressor